MDATTGVACSALISFLLFSTFRFFFFLSALLGSSFFLLLIEANPMGLNLPLCFASSSWTSALTESEGCPASANLFSFSSRTNSSRVRFLGATCSELCTADDSAKACSSSSTSFVDSSSALALSSSSRAKSRPLEGGGSTCHLCRYSGSCLRSKALLTLTS